MSAEDRARWDERYADREPPSAGLPNLPADFQPFAEVFPTVGLGLDVACGYGSAGLWLARRGLEVRGIDISAVAIAAARDLALASGLAAHCRFDVADLDDGLPAGPPADVIICNKFREARLDEAIVDRLAPGGLLAISVLSEVGAKPGPFRVAAGELRQAFGALDLIANGEGHGVSWLLARR